MVILVRGVHRDWLARLYPAGTLGGVARSKRFCGFSYRQCSCFVRCEHLGISGGSIDILLNRIGILNESAMELRILKLPRDDKIAAMVSMLVTQSILRVNVSSSLYIPCNCCTFHCVRCDRIWSLDPGDVPCWLRMSSIRAQGSLVSLSEGPFLPLGGQDRSTRWNFKFC